MRIAICVLVSVACNKQVDESALYVELAAVHGKTINAIAAWLPLMERKDGLIDRRLALRARHEIAALAKPYPADDHSLSAALGETLNKARLCKPLATSEDTDAYCKDAIAELRIHLSSLAIAARKAGATGDQILTLDKPDRGTQERVDSLLALVAPGPKAKAWNAAKANEMDPTTFDARCAAAGEEWKARFESDKASRDFLSEVDFTGGFRECRATTKAADVLKSTSKDCSSVWATERDLDLIPKYFVVKIAAEATACRDRYK